MNLSCSCILCCYLFLLSLFSSIFIHLSTLWHFHSGELHSQSLIRVLTGGGVPICKFYPILLQYHHKFSIRLLKREGISLLHCVIHCRLKNNVSISLLNTTLRSDDNHRVVGLCRKQLNRCKCVFCNLIDSFWICLDGGYTCLCICYHVGWAEGSRWVFEKLSLMMLPADTVKASHV